MKVALTFWILCWTAFVHADEPWIIDPHTHFKGAEQVKLERATQTPHPKNTLAQVVVPEDYRELADRLRIQSTLVVEAVDQSAPQFNTWLLEQAESELVCGYVARGDLRSAVFADRYAEYKTTGYLNGYRFRFDELASYLDHGTARQNLKRLQDDQMVVDLLVDPKHAAAVRRLAGEFPRLRIVINHCFRARMKNGIIDDEWKEAVTSCAAFENVYCKLSSIVNFSDAKVFTQEAPTDLSYYLPVLDPCFDAFGEDRVIFATNWGVCTHFGTVDDVVRMATEYFESKGAGVTRKAMRDNAIRVYNIDPAKLR
ncbi:MAG: amidohydrolase family protein [Planctomycetota bacterium]